METKQCCSCGETKEVIDFCFDKKDNRYQSSCKSCNNNRTKAWQKQLFESTNPTDILEATFYKMCTGSRSNAKTKGIQFTLRLDDLRSMYQTQQGKCFYTGVPMTLRSNGHLDRDPLLISLDRRDSSLGYTKENTVLCCWGANALKGWHSENTFYTTLKLFYENAHSLGKL